MGRVTINGTQSQFSCKQSFPLNLWDMKGNRAKGQSRETLQINHDLDNIKAQFIKHYQHLCGHEVLVTAEIVRHSALATLCLKSTSTRVLTGTLRLCWIERRKAKPEQIRQGFPIIGC